MDEKVWVGIDVGRHAHHAAAVDAFDDHEEVALHDGAILALPLASFRVRLVGKGAAS